jgi:hypothetical protein
VGNTKTIIANSVGTATITVRSAADSTKYVSRTVTVYPDYTTKINELFENAIEQCWGNRCMSWGQYCSWLNSLSVLLTPSVSDHLGLTLGSFLWFYDQVKPGAVWDVKKSINWANALPDCPFLGVSTGRFMFRGELITAEDLGNIMYGYTGRATGFGDITLYWGGGVAKQGSINSPALTVAPYYGDDINDHIRIKQGYEMFEADYPAYSAVGYNGIPIEPGILAAMADLFI